MKHITLSLMSAGIALCGGMFFMFLAERSPKQSLIKKSSEQSSMKSSKQS